MGKINKTKKEALLKQQIALITAEELALSLVPLFLAVNEVGGVARAISILKKAKEGEKS